MTKRTWKRIAFTVLGVFVLGVIVLAIHIYIVTRPRVDAGTRVLVRIDMKQDIDSADAGKITAWLYQQKGVDHVLVNPESNIAVFSFAPVQNNATQIVGRFKQELPYKAERYLPSEEEMKNGCPVATTSMSYKAYSFIKQLF
ncbi:MAG: hypothetical protein JST68_00805 [Bacteroidetes bacterium]|nr:hypothetical protein [Bacteroidota bacterium]